MIQDQFHLCDEISRFGFTAHGLAVGTHTGTQVLRVDGVDFPLPFEWTYQSDNTGEPYDTHLLKVPGIAEVTLTPEEVAAEKAEGRTWQNYALLSEDRLQLFGQVLDGWVCIDSTGERWLVKCDPAVNRMTFNSTAPLTLQVSVQRFGHLDEEEEVATTQAVTLANVGQSATFQAPPSANLDPNMLMLAIGSISSDGRKAVLEIRGQYSVALSSTIRANTAPAGFLLLEIAGDGPSFVITLTVLRTREQVLGTYEERRVQPRRCQLDMTWSSVSSPRLNGADVVATLTGVSCTEVAGSPSQPWLGAGWVGDVRTGRIAALIFDDANNLVEFSYDAMRRCDFNYPQFNATVSGDTRGWIADSSNFTDSGVTSTATASIERTSTELITGKVTIKRDGVAVSDGGFTVERTILESRTVALDRHLRRVGGQVIGALPSQVWGSDAAFSYSTVFTADEGVGAVSWNLSPFSSLFAYTLGLWTGLTGSTTPKPYGYGASVDYGSNPADNYAGATLRLQRLANNVFGVSVQAKAGLLPARWRVPSLVAPQATWNNPASQDGSASRLASYQPYTHEIFTTYQGSGINTPFVWI